MSVIHHEKRAPWKDKVFLCCLSSCFSPCGPGGVWADLIRAPLLLICVYVCVQTQTCTCINPHEDKVFIFAAASTDSFCEGAAYEWAHCCLPCSPEFMSLQKVKISHLAVLIYLVQPWDAVNMYNKPTVLCRTCWPQLHTQAVPLWRIAFTTLISIST